MKQTGNEFSKDEMIALEHLRKLRLPVMASAFEEQLRDPNADLKTFTQRFCQLIDQ